MIRRILSGQGRTRSTVISVVGGVALLLLAATVFAVASQARSLSSQAERAVQTVENLRVVSLARSELSVASRLAQIGPDQELVISGAIENSMSALDSVEQNFDETTSSEIRDSFGEFRLASETQAAQILQSGQDVDGLRVSEIETGEAFATLVDDMRAEQISAIEGLQADNDLMNLIATVSAFIVAFVVPSAALFIFQALRTSPRQLRTLRLEHDQLESSSRAMATAISTEAKELREELTKDGAGNHERTIASLLRFERITSVNGSPNSLRIESLDIAELVEGSIRSSNSPTAIQFHADSDLVAQGDRTQLSLVVSELVTNALDHGSKPVQVSVKAAGTNVEVRVIDHGLGLPKAVEDTVIHESEYALRRNLLDGANGFGLVASRRTLESMGASLRYERLGDATHMVVSLPGANSVAEVVNIDSAVQTDLAA